MFALAEKKRQTDKFALFPPCFSSYFENTTLVYSMVNDDVTERELPAKDLSANKSEH